MIKCPNCAMMNIDDTLLCEGCAWDLLDQPRWEDTPEGQAAGGVEGVAVAEAQSISFDAVPMAQEFVPDESLPEASAYEMPAADAPTTPAFPSSAKATKIPPPAAPTTLRPPTGLDYPPAPPGQTQMRPPTGMPQQPTGIPRQPSSLRPRTAVVPPPPSFRPPTQQQPPAALAPRVTSLAPEERPKLVVVVGLKKDLAYLIYDGDNFIGRSDETPVDIDIADQEAQEKAKASRQHACVSWENGTMFVRDLGSANGTFVNRQRLTDGEKRQLKNGDYIQTGGVMFQVKYS